MERLSERHQLAEATEAFKINGKAYSAADLSFREQRDLRTEVRKLVEDPTAEVLDVAFMDYLPALVYVIERRDDPEFTIEQALEMKLESDEEDAPPTTPAKPARKPRK